ncbi:MAG: hypothetical protein ACOX46_01500 [Limnochordia bacterium]|nr:hypothetical protein [Bacillota bacterium]NLL07642.1 hypothetical protein [Bacillota bacterium]
MVFCRHLRTTKDGDGKLEFHCVHFDRRIDLDLLEGCRQCPKYESS